MHMHCENDLFRVLYLIQDDSSLIEVSVLIGKVEPGPHTSSFNMGYLVSPYSYTNGAAGPIPVSMVSFLIYIFLKRNSEGECE